MALGKDAEFMAILKHLCEKLDKEDDQELKKLVMKKAKKSELEKFELRE